jgi:hypothetical protein
MFGRYGIRMDCHIGDESGAVGTAMRYPLSYVRISAAALTPGSNDKG